MVECADWSVISRIKIRLVRRFIVTNIRQIFDNIVCGELLCILLTKYQPFDYECFSFQLFQNGLERVAPVITSDQTVAILLGDTSIVTSFAEFSFCPGYSNLLNTFFPCLRAIHH